LIGGNGFKRTLPLAARYATIWNGTFLTPNNFRQRSRALDELLRAAGRKPEDVRRTMMLTLFFGRDMEELDRRLGWRHHQPELANKPLNAVIETLSAGGRALVGKPDMLVKQIQAYANVGVQELMLQWFDQDDIEGLQAFAASVLPHV
jgi:alkanesulfonate monooxygenase SsuD/methylene tetrahydromethanopterin reductase-like flavin-dependent oxidoreductase (luciferase family)